MNEKETEIFHHESIMIEVPLGFRRYFKRKYKKKIREYNNFLFEVKRII